MLMVLCAVLAAGWLCNHPVLDALGVTETDYVEAMAIPFQQVARVVAEEKPMSPEDQAMIEEIFDTELLKEVYDPLTVDPVKFEAFRHDRRAYLMDNLGSYGKLWLRLGRQNPWTYTKAWIDETMGYWNAGYHYWIYPEGERPEYGIVRPEIDNPVASCFDALFRLQQRIPFLAQPLFGIGFQVWILILCLTVNAARRREERLLCLPILVVVLGLWVGTPVFAEFRYAYPVFITVPLLASVTIFDS